jgi:hypothetical protein
MLAPGSPVSAHYSTFLCSLVFIEEASELAPLEVPLGLSA